MKESNKFLCIHGHFYQPPRENPWTNAIEIQESALPNHDWNERIYQECYKPNSCSHILSPDGKISQIVNNYEYLSFNMGPTLLGWIKKEHPRTYERIQDADIKSRERLDGHGNAIAQVYNHMIMPLASRKDRLTQIRWGMKDFEKHFNRKTDSIWLAETAINMETVVDLINEGIRFVILAPSQAWRFRKMGSEKNEDWTNRENADIDTTRPYRIYPNDEKGNPLCEGHLDVFFYHDLLSRAVSFERILNDAQTLNNRIFQSFDVNNKKSQLINLATDGESYGHHHKHGDMCLSYYFKKLVPYSELEIVNYSWYLENFPPEYEVQLKNQWGEGTAWSCAHGVGRWYRDCGCQTGGPEDWNQEWRKPLRDSLDYLKSIADKIYETQMKKLTKEDPWKIRDQYIDVLFDPENEVIISEFISKVFGKSISGDLETKFLNLMEMQKFAMYSFTSCGWFFNDIEGLEPMQNLKYARKTIEFINEITNENIIEKEFRKRLALAISNESKKTGEELYVENVIPDRNVIELIIGAAVFAGGFTHSSFDKKLWKFNCVGKVIQKSEYYRLWSTETVDVQLRKKSTRLILTLRSEFQEDVIFVYPEGTKANNIELPEENFITKREACLYFPSATNVAVGDLFADHLQDIFDIKTKESFENVCSEFKDFPKKYNFFYGVIEQKNVKIPEYISTPIKLSFNAEINYLVRDLLDNSNSKAMPLLEQYVEHASLLDISLNTEWILEDFVSLLWEWLGEVLEDKSIENLKQLSNLVHISDIMGMQIDKAEIQNVTYSLYQDYRKASSIEKMRKWQPYQSLFQWLDFHL